MYEVYKYYKYFHIFFKWDVRYIVKTSCCGCLYELDPLVGKEFEKYPSTEIREENLQRIDRYSPFKYCSNCRTEVPVEYSYCPYCGERL